MKNIFQGKSILVTGGTGSIGSEIVRRVLQYDPKVVRVFSSDEDAQFSLSQELQGYSNIRLLFKLSLNSRKLCHHLLIVIYYNRFIHVLISWMTQFNSLTIESVILVT